MDTFAILLLILAGAIGGRRGAAPTVERRAALEARVVHRDELRQLVRDRKLVAAIRLYRQDTGASLVEAKAAVDGVAAELRTAG